MWQPASPVLVVGSRVFAATCVVCLDVWPKSVWPESVWPVSVDDCATASVRRAAVMRTRRRTNALLQLELRRPKWWFARLPCSKPDQPAFCSSFRRCGAARLSVEMRTRSRDTRCVPSSPTPGIGSIGHSRMRKLQPRKGTEPNTVVLN
eukprot:2487847-Rhodomonas_salina.2